MQLIQPIRQAQPPRQAAGKQLLPVDPYTRNSRHHLTLFEASLHGLSLTGIEFLSEDVRDA